ncbi:hypothetical protein [Georgenia subflava]|uniref:hypothetical protein n=1 Tax=Georgenia subflava TaxID=1622177 RepID=UPI00186AC8E8|nr:hypothetical protein [Georgenia subflava]
MPICSEQPPARAAAAGRGRPRGEYLDNTDLANLLEDLWAGGRGANAYNGRAHQIR